MAETEITAAEAALGFAGLLEAVERGGARYRITFDGRPVAMLGPIDEAGEPLQDPRDELGAEGNTFPDVPDEVAKLLRPTAERAPLLHQLLLALEELGCVLSPPGGQHRDDYVNVTPAGSRQRLLSVHVATGRVQFEAGSYDRIGDRSPRYAYLGAGNKAAHPLDTAADLHEIIDAAHAELVRRGDGGGRVPPPPSPPRPPISKGGEAAGRGDWEKYRDRYGARPETFEAYVDVWQRVPGVQRRFTGWASFSQAANKEPAQADQNVRDAEAFMRQGGYEIGTLTSRGARRWRRAAR